VRATEESIVWTTAFKCRTRRSHRRTDGSAVQPFCTSTGRKKNWCKAFSGYVVSMELTERSSRAVKNVVVSAKGQKGSKKATGEKKIEKKKIKREKGEEKEVKSRMGEKKSHFRSDRTGRESNKLSTCVAHTCE